ncbi:MAG: hypothetical protein ACLQHF_12335 [Terracidiphilus sp.]
MYAACRHIKPTGLRCQSPAMRGHAFCYFHAKAHGITRNSARANLLLPMAEEHAAVQMAVHQIIQALLAKQIDAKEAGVMLYGIQIASQTLKVEFSDPPDSVPTAVRSSEGEELAPPLCVEEDDDDEDSPDCSRCAHRHNCRDYTPSEDDEEEDAPEEENEEQEGQSSEKASQSEGIVENVAAAGALQEPFDSPCKRSTLILRRRKTAETQQTIEGMNPVALLKAFMKLNSTG